MSGNLGLSESKRGLNFLSGEKTILTEDENIKLIAKQSHDVLQLTQTDGIVENTLYLTPEDQEKIMEHIKELQLERKH